MKILSQDMNLNKKGHLAFALLFFSPLLYGFIVIDTYEEIVESLSTWRYERIAISLCLVLMCLIWMLPPVANYFAKDKEKKCVTVLAAKYSSVLLIGFLLFISYI
ncbi:MAG: hypothetical protein ACSHX8_08940 [Opitutaceae bacterium]